jgi:hypothetical protein
VQLKFEIMKTWPKHPLAWALVPKRYAISTAVCLMATLFAVCVGCASKESAPAAVRPGGGIAEYRQIATEATKSIQAALLSLNTVAAQSNRCSPEVLLAFSSQVQRLQVESIQVRARSQAMLARGDAYFEHWQDNIARVGDPKVRALAESRRPLIQPGFQQVKSLSQQGHEAFKPFLAGLRKLRNELEKAPDTLDSSAARETIQLAREKGGQVEGCLAGIQQELDSMSVMVTPPTTAPHK